MKKITIVGAGISGLVTAYYFVKNGWSVEIYEKYRLGGLVNTISTPNGKVETAASGILSSKCFEELCEDIKVELQKTKFGFRYFYYQRLRRFPLSLKGLFLFLYGLIYGKFTDSLKPTRLETLWDWSQKNFGSEFTERVVAIAPNGIYACGSKKLSAHLVVGRLFNREKIEKGKFKGLVAPKNGMRQLVERLEFFLKQKQTQFFRYEFCLPEKITNPIVLCTNAKDAGKITEAIDKDLSSRLMMIDLIPLISVTLFYPSNSHQIRGFGVLFGPEEGFNSLGVLFNSDIFENRVENSNLRSETWILGGDDRRDFINLDENQILELIVRDRRKLSKKKSDNMSEQEPLNWEISKWPQAIPKYSLELEKHLPKLKSTHPLIYLNGNYLGRIGLGQIILHTKNLVDSILKSDGEKTDGALK